MKTVRILGENRTIEHYQNGKLHRENGPAKEFVNGRKEWWWNGKLHRVDGPAIETADNSYQAWHYHGLLHRDGQPAIIERTDNENGEFKEQWWHWGQLHREDGPAYIDEEDCKEFWLYDVAVPEFVVMEPHKITIENINKAKNYEIRSIMIERYGWQRFIAELNAELIDSRHDEENDIKESLFSSKNSGNILVLQCHSGRIYTTTDVPPTVVSCAEAHDLRHLVNSDSQIYQEEDWKKIHSPFTLVAG
jgi:hypothetical protein